MTSKRAFRTLIALTLPFLIASAAVAQTPLSFDKAFNPATIGPGGVSMLTFNLVNNTTNPAADVAFTDALPAAVMIATPANPVSSCGGTLSAPDGGGTISLTGGQIGASGSCAITVNVTSSTVGVHMNTTDTLTSSIGNGGTASADLTVTADRPGFSKSFSPAAVGFEGRSTLTFTIDNTANASAVTSMSFTDDFPANMTIASPTNAMTDCGTSTIPPTLTAVAGASSVSFNANGTFAFPAVAAGASCTVAVDVIGGALGALGNVSNELTSSSGGGSFVSSGKASATLTVTTQPIALIKRFTDDPVAPGGTVTLEFTVFNIDRSDSATNIAFTDDLDAVLSGLAATGLPANDVCGAGSVLSGTSVISLAGGELPAEGTCTFSVSVQVPAAAATGAFTNTTSQITADVGGDPETGDPASDVLFVQPSPILAKTFLGDPVSAGGSIDLEFTITNGSQSSSATDITFSDAFVEELPTASAIPADGFCGVNSTATFTPLAGFNPAQLVVSGADLGPGGSCTFTVTLDVAVAAAAGTYSNVTSTITATVDGVSYSGASASDTFDVIAPPGLTKEFIDDPVNAGGVVTLRFRLNYDNDGDGIPDIDLPGPASGITFTDNLEATVSGLAPSGALPAEPCGAGSTLTFASGLLTLSGGELDPTVAATAACSFDVVLAVPAGASAGTYTNTTSGVVATVLGVQTTGPPASDNLRIGGLTLSKSFTDDPVAPGGTVTLEFTITNLDPSASATATNIFFTDDLDLDDDLGTLAATGLPANDVCGAGSSLVGSAGNTFLTFSGGTLAPASSCTFSVILQVDPLAVSNDYVNTTSALSATIFGAAAVFDPASDVLAVNANLLAISKSFTDDPVAPGGVVTLEFTIDNLDAARAVSDVAFTDDLDGVLTGLAAIGLPANDVCGAGSVLDGTGLLSLTGGSIAAGDSCTFSVSVQVPVGATPDTYVNTTSVVSGTIAGGAVTGDPATDDLMVDFMGFDFSKAFDGDGVVGSTVDLTFTIENLSATQAAAELSFTDDLEAVLTGLVAVGLPASEVCGSGSELTGTSLLTLTRGTLLPLGSCTFTVQLQVPAGATPGDYPNVTSDLLQNGVSAANPATATLTVIPDDTDGDGVRDPDDVCPGTVLPESAPTSGTLKNNRYALNPLFDPDPAAPFFTFQYGGGNGPTLTTEDTGGCSCEQIAAAVPLGGPHLKFGCTQSSILSWIAMIGGGGESPLAAGRGAASDAPEAKVEGPANGLTVVVEGPGGSVTSNRVELADGRTLTPLACSGECTKVFPAGSVVTLQARPDSERYEFLGWGGDCSGSRQIVTVELGIAARCTARFGER